MLSHQADHAVFMWEIARGLRLTAKENRSVVKTLGMFSAMMVAFPIGTFFAFYDFLLLGEKRVYVCSGACPAE